MSKWARKTLAAAWLALLLPGWTMAPAGVTLHVAPAAAQRPAVSAGRPASSPLHDIVIANGR
ncbi:MAG TPA: hypothetical protein VF282_07610, partial [Bacillota bacterium]